MKLVQPKQNAEAMKRSVFAKLVDEQQRIHGSAIVTLESRNHKQQQRAAILKGIPKL